MARTSRSLDASMRLEEKVPISGFSDAAINDGSREAIRLPISLLLLGRIEACMVALAADNDGDFGLLCVGRVHQFACVANQWQFFA